MRGPEKRKKRLFGTNGVRDVVGEGMTPELVMHIGMALASMRRGTIAVGRDTRTSGPALSSAIRAGILSCGSDAVDLGVLPTPALQYLVRRHFDAGVVITASHNPPQYNGVKVIEPDGTEMGDEETIALEEILFKERFSAVGWREVGGAREAPEMIKEYIDAVVGHFPPGIGRGMSVVVDPGFGPATLTTPSILTAMGCRVLTVNAQMDGTFPGRLPEPSPEGLSLLSRKVVETGAAFGVAHDGDADRAVFVDEKGRYVEENAEFALMQRHICRKRAGIVVTPVSTSRLAEKIAGETGSRVIYTPVGSIYVARTMLDLAARGEVVAFGGEGNGGLIFPDHQHCRDGGMTAAAMVHLIAETKRSLSELVGTLPPMVMIKEKISADDPEELLEMAKQRFSGEDLDLVDGVRINRKDSWALLRPSGTEPFMRLVVEAETKETADEFCREIRDAIGRGD